MRIRIVGLLFLTSVFFAAQQGALAQTGELVGPQQFFKALIALGALRESDSPLLGGAQGVIVTQIIPGSQAASVGIMVNDVVVRYGSTPVLNSAQLVKTIKAAPANGQSIAIEVIRDGDFLGLWVQPGSIGIQLLDVSDQTIQAAQTAQALIDRQMLPNGAAMVDLQKEANTAIGWEAQKDSERLLALIKQERQSRTSPQGASAQQRAEAIVAQLQQSAASPRASTTKRAAVQARVELPREVVSEAPRPKVKFKQIPVYYKPYKGRGSLTVAGHFTGMVEKEYAHGWGRLKLNNGVTIVSRFGGGRPRGLTKITYSNGYKTYLALPNNTSFCGRPDIATIVYKKDKWLFYKCSKTEQSYGKAPGVTYSKDLVVLGDHPIYLFAYMIREGAFEPWMIHHAVDKRKESADWRYARYSPKTKMLDIEYSNKANNLRHARKFKNGRSWIAKGSPGFKYGGGYLCTWCGADTDITGDATYIHPLGFSVNTAKGTWVEEKTPDRTIRRFKPEYPEFSGLNPEPVFEEYTDGGRFQAETINSVPEGFGYEYHPDGTEIWGQYHKGVLHGDALIMKPDGSRLYANYKDGELDGQVIHTVARAPLHPIIATTPSPSLDAPFKRVEQLADQYDALLRSSKGKAKKLGKKIVKEQLLAGLPVNGSFLNQDRALLPQGWQDHFKQPSRSVSKASIDTINSYMTKDQLLAEYAALNEGYSDKWPSELKMTPQLSFKVSSWSNGVKTGEKVISRWSMCRLEYQKARFVSEKDQKSTTWANKLGDMRIMQEQWFVPESICRAGIPQGEGIAISGSGRWIITDAVFEDGRLVSGKRQSFSSANVGYVGAIKNGNADGWGYKRYVTPSGKRAYYRGEFKDGRFDGKGHLYSDTGVIHGTFAKGQVHGDTKVLAGPSLETVTYRDGKKVGPMTKILMLTSKTPNTYDNEPFFATASGNYNEHGNLDGPYKRVRDDGFVLFEGTMDDGRANGTLSSEEKLPEPTKYVNADVSHMYGPSVLRRAAYHTTRATFKNGNVVHLTDTAGDGTLVYEGTGKSLYKGGTNFDYLIAKRQKGRCYFNGRYENCEYYNNNSVGQTRSDRTSQQRGAGIEQASVARDADFHRRMDEEENARKRKKQARKDRDRQRAREVASWRAANKERAQQADRDLVARVYGGKSTADISSGGRSNLYDPLNPNNPNTKALNKQVQRTVTNHQKAQQQAKDKYNADLAARNAQIEAQRNSQRNTQSSGTTSSSSSSSWDCDRQWRADKCGDRHTVHKINRLNNAYTGEHPSNSRNGSGNGGSNGNGDGSQTASNTNNGNGAGNSNSNSNSNSGPKMGPLIGEALAICRPKKTDPDLWWCDGPTQRLILADDPLSVQLSAVGCGSATPSSQRLALDDRHFVFFCKYGLQKSDRNIAAIHGLPGHILAKRKSYQCKKNNISRCTTRASPSP